MLKVTLKFAAAVLIFLLNACNHNTVVDEKEKNEHIADSLTEAIIDSAYIAINQECDTLMKYRVPVLADSILKGDSLTIKKFSDSICSYKNNNSKIEKVIRQLKADCDANLLKETYKRVQQLQKAKPVRRLKR